MHYRKKFRCHGCNTRYAQVDSCFCTICEDGTSPDFRESPEFLDYSVHIAVLLWQADRPLSIAEIHAALGEGIRRRWTADALESLKITEIGFLPTRYKLNILPKCAHALVHTK